MKGLEEGECGEKLTHSSSKILCEKSDINALGFVEGN